MKESISSGSSKPLMMRTKRLLANMVRFATTYLILRPRFMGAGVDMHSQHPGAQRLGKERWYSHYELRVTKVERIFRPRGALTTS